MSTDASITVAIPTWNRAGTLIRAVSSALNQSLPPIEILVCDDGSTDDSRQAVMELQHSNVRWLAGPHSGRPAVPRNRGLREARGEWIAFLDSDDTWLPEKLERQMAAVYRTGCLASCTNAWRVTRDKPNELYLVDTFPPVLSFADLAEGNPVICSSALLHRSVLNQAGGFPEDEALRAIEDHALWLRVAAHTGFVYLPEALVVYTDEPEQSIRKPGGSEFGQRKRVLRDFLEWAQSDPRLKPLTQRARAALRRLPLREAASRLRLLVSRVRSLRP